MKILIVSGLFGRGKNKHLSNGWPGTLDQRFAILENDNGAAGIDGARLGQNRQGTQKKCMGNDRAVHLLHREKGFCSIRADHCQCGRPGIPDRRTDRRRKSRPGL